MWLLRRRRPGSQGDRVHPDRFVLEDVRRAPEPPPDPGRRLRRIAAEAVLLQDEAEALLTEIRVERSLGRVAPRAGPLVRRFFALQDALPTTGCGPDLVRLSDEMAAILQHHALALSVAMDFLAYEWRSPTLAGHLDALTDLGGPARRLDEICALLTSRSEPTHSRAGAGPR